MTRFKQINKINFFIKIMNDLITNSDKSYIKRINKNKENNKLNFRNILYSSSHIINNSSIDIVRSNLEIDDIIDVSKNAIIKKRNNISTYEHIKSLNNSLLSHIYDPSNNLLSNNIFSIDDNNKSFSKLKKKKNKLDLYINRSNKRFIAFDGTDLNVSINLVNNDTVTLSKSSDYGKVLLCNSYDVINNIPINYHITPISDNKKKSENYGIINQLHLFGENDVLIFDRLFFSNKLMQTLIEHNINFIFRVKNNSNLFKNMNNGKSKIVKHLNLDVQLFKYKIKSENYSILTSILDNISIAEIKALYWNRWNIETDNRIFKYDILFNNIRSKTYNSFLTDIETIRFLSIVSSYLKNVGNSDIYVSKKINGKNLITQLFNKLLYLFFYGCKSKKEYNKKIKIIINVIFKTLVEIVKNRSYERKRLFPSTKWNKNGNRYGRSKKKEEVDMQYG
jgi:hypothetical protein